MILEVGATCVFLAQFKHISNNYMSKKPKKSNPSIPIKNEVVKEVPSYWELSDSLLKNHWWKALLFFVFAFIIYFKTVNYGYVLDDTIVVENNNFTKKGFGGLWDILTTESMTGYFGEQKNLVQGNRYRPLSIMTFAIEYGIMGDMKPGLSHFINILLYALSCIFIMRVFQLLLPQRQKLFGLFDFGFLVALLYLVHPLHVEAVANIKGRDEIMAMLFSMMSLYFFILHYLYGRGRMAFYLAILSYLLGLLSKENTITFLAVIPLSMYFFGEKNKGKAWNVFFVLLGSTILYLIFRFSVSGVPKLNEKIIDIMNNPFLEMSGLERFATVMYTLGLYIKLLFFPYPLTHDYYPYAIPKMNFGDWQAILSLLFYLALTYFGFKGLKSKSISSYAILFYLFTLSIASNLIINLGTFMNDRFIYMPSLGFCLLLMWAIMHFREKLSDALKISITGLFIVSFAVLSFLRVPAWENAMSLNRSAIKISHNSARANTFMSTALFEEAKVTTDAKKKLTLLEEAFPYAQKAVNILPKYYNANLMYAGIAGELYSNSQQLDRTLDAFKTVANNRPDVDFLTQYLNYLNGRGADMNKMLLFYQNTGKSLMEQKTADGYKWAIHFMKIGLQLFPNDKLLNQFTGESFKALGDVNQANPYLIKAANQ